MPEDPGLDSCYISLFFVVLSDFWVMSDFANIGKLLKLCFHNLQFIYLNIITELITILL